MEKSRLSAVSHFVHARFLWFVIGSYVVAAVAPRLGVAIRGVSLGTTRVFGSPTTLSLPVVMLGMLLFNAGLGVQTRRLGGLLRRPFVLLTGLAANLLVPVAFILLVSQVLRVWPEADEAQNVLVGLALVASMPIAGSSTAWAQNANGDLALSLGLVVCSTLLSPLTTPVALHAIGFVSTGDYAEDLHELASSGTGSFLAVSVIVPSLLGMATNAVVGDARVANAKPTLKLLNSFVLLLLNYSNASQALPQTIRDPDWDFLAVILVIVTGLCAAGFVAGWLVARLFRANTSERVSLVFGLGMTNNGTGLVLAAMALADHPRVLLPIVFYNLVQHLVAGAVDRILVKDGRGS